MHHTVLNWIQRVEHSIWRCRREKRQNRYHIECDPEIEMRKEQTTMLKDGKILIGKNNESEIWLDPAMANRHGMIAGATGTGKTVSLKVLAESFSDAGVPVFLADIKGDLGSLAQEGVDEEHVTARVASMNLAADGYAYRK